MSNSLSILDIGYNYSKASLNIEFGWPFIILLVLIIFITLVIICIKYFDTRNNIHIDSVKLSLGAGSNKVEYTIQRNYENLEIAHKIYIELMTRKAALPFDEAHDVVKEIYDSWYALFQVTREEIKKLPGKHIQNNSEQAEELIKMALYILNDGLRPHLTQYQAQFRKWYDEELAKDENKGKTPQEIQKNFSNYTDLVKSMKEVNELLMDYSEQLNKFIKG